MKKLLFAMSLLALFFTACDSSSDESLDDLKKENQELKDALAANAKIESVEFTETEMILTYSNGLKVSTAIPEVLKGEPGTTPHIGDNGNWWIGDADTGVAAQGQDGVAPHIGENGNWFVGDTDTGIVAMGKNGADGVGIKSITFDSKTGVMTITLTNGQASTFVISNNGSGLSATIQEDLNGAYLVKKITMGDVPYAEIEYTDDYQIKKITSYSANGYQIFKRFEVEKEYTNGKPSKIVTRQFAMEKTVKYSEEVWNQNGIEYVSFDTYRGAEFIEENTDGSYFYYQGGDEYDDGRYHYERYYATKGSRLENELVSNGDGTYKIYRHYTTYYVENGDGSYTRYPYYRVYDKGLVFDEPQGDRELSVKISDNQFEIYNHGYDYNGYYDCNISGIESRKYFYTLRCTRTIEGTYELGELMNETISQLVYNSDGELEKIYEFTNEGEEASVYQQNYFNGQGNLAKTERYEKVDGNWIKDTHYLTYEYNAQNLLTQTIDNDGKGNERALSKIVYDNEGNPTEVLKYSGEQFEYRWMVDPATGIGKYQDVKIAEAGLHSVAKIEYNYTMKNFFGNTFAGLFPELYGFNFKNALKAVAVSNSPKAGAIEYKDFNDGGYPETMEFLGWDEEMYSFSGQLKIEYLKKEE